MLLDIRNLKKSYQNITIFDNFNLSIRENMITCILGPSGIGKTTLLNLLSGISKPDSGDLTDFANKTFSYIFQETRLLKWKTVFENVNFVLKNIYGEKESREAAKNYIDIVGLSKFAGYYPSQISGGMQQRVSIARAFAYPSDILLMDEPFKSLDMKLKKNLIAAFLKLWQSDKRTVISVTHEAEEAAYIGNDVVILTDTLPASVKDRFTFELEQQQRIADYQFVRQIKRTLIESF